MSTAITVMGAAGLALTLVCVAVDVPGAEPGLSQGRVTNRRTVAIMSRPLPGPEVPGLNPPKGLATTGKRGIWNGTWLFLLLLRHWPVQVGRG